MSYIADGLTRLNFFLSVCLILCTLSGLDQKSHYKRFTLIPPEYAYHVYYSEWGLTASVKLHSSKFHRFQNLTTHPNHKF